MNELENIDNINIDELYNRIVVLIEKAKIQLEQRKNIEDEEQLNSMKLLINSYIGFAKSLIWEQKIIGLEISKKKQIHFQMQKSKLNKRKEKKDDIVKHDEIYAGILKELHKKFDK